MCRCRIYLLFRQVEGKSEFGHFYVNQLWLRSQQTNIIINRFMMCVDDVCRDGPSPPIYANVKIMFFAFVADFYCLVIVT